MVLVRQHKQDSVGKAHGVPFVLPLAAIGSATAAGTGDNNAQINTCLSAAPAALSEAA